MRTWSGWVYAIAAVLTSTCARPSTVPVSATFGAAPLLVAPRPQLVPDIEVVTAIGWAGGATPLAQPGLRVNAFARGLDHPRWLYVLPNGDVLVAETNAPPRPNDHPGVRGWLVSRVRHRAGGGRPSADRLTLLRDRDGDGEAETRTTFLANLHSPLGMALVGDTLYVANTDAVVKVRYTPGATVVRERPTTVAALPAGSRNRHWTRSLVASPDGRRLYVGIGADSNAGEFGEEAEQGRAEIREIDLRTGVARAYATGLRNPVGLAWEPSTGALWTAVNERDGLGPDLVPDYLTSVHDGGFYGFPFGYFGTHVDTRVQPMRPDLVATAIRPEYALGAHTASLGLAHSATAALGPQFASGMFVGQHGSWNRSPLAGYQVIFVPFAAGRPSGPPIEVLSGVVLEDGHAMGRPAGLAVDGRGHLLVADDAGNTVWRVSARPASATR